MARKNAGRTAGRESRGGGLGAGGWLRAIVVAVLVSPFAGGCGAVLGGMVVGGNAGMVGGAVLMVIAGAVLSIGASQWAQERKEIHQYRLHQARGEE
ncbi:MAG: hypothetical protein OXR64_09810 [Chloroflexota bacterium]|nr:hypothetical protein [Chloroflexota bacterium]